MASTEQAVIPPTEKAVDDSQVMATQEFLVLVTGVMKKLLGRGMSLTKTHTWEGRFIGEPGAIGEYGAFVHQGSPTLGPLQVVVGSKGAVIYGTFDKALPQLGWLLAWHKPAQNSSESNKVYVEAGHLSNLVKMEWSEVLEKLNASNSKSRYFDSDTGAVATAEIEDKDDKLALVFSTFDQTIA